MDAALTVMWPHSFMELQMCLKETKREERRKREKERHRQTETQKGAKYVPTPSAKP